MVVDVGGIYQVADCQGMDVLVHEGGNVDDFNVVMLGEIVGGVDLPMGEYDDQVITVIV